ncbi:hypothetical protein U3516DRAFT_673445 [Neocallimastix sp. 'constans']
MSDCRDYSSVVSKVHRFNDETKCWPSIWNQFHIQDDFELRYQDKWELISDALNNRICSRGIYVYYFNDFTYIDRVATELEENKVEIFGIKKWTDFDYLFSQVSSILGKRDRSKCLNSSYDHIPIALTPTLNLTCSTMFGKINSEYVKILYIKFMLSHINK